MQWKRCNRPSLIKQSNSMNNRRCRFDTATWQIGSINKIQCACAFDSNPCIDVIHQIDGNVYICSKQLIPESIAHPILMWFLVNYPCDCTITGMKCDGRTNKRPTTTWNEFRAQTDRWSLMKHSSVYIIRLDPYQLHLWNGHDMANECGANEMDVWVSSAHLANAMKDDARWNEAHETMKITVFCVDWSWADPQHTRMSISMRGDLWCIRTVNICEIHT